MPRVVVIGGDPDKRSVEIGGPPELSPSCLSLPDLSHSPEGPVAGMVAGKLVVCFGRDISKCSSHNKASSTWEETADSGSTIWLPASISVSENEWWIAGGQVNGSKSDSSLVFDGTAFAPSHTLPYRTMGSCLVRVNATHFFLTGGMRITIRRRKLHKHALSSRQLDQFFRLVLQEFRKCLFDAGKH